MILFLTGQAYIPPTLWERITAPACQGKEMSATNDVITFFDLTSLLQDKAWSPNTWKIRLITYPHNLHATA